MNTFKLIKKWVLCVSALLFLLGCGFFAAMGEQDSSGKIIAALLALICISASLAVLAFAYKRAVSAIDQGKTEQKTAPITTERDEYQYTFKGAQTVANHTVIDYAPTEYDAQVMLYKLNVGDEIHVFRNYSGKYTYTMDDDIPLPPRLVNIFEHKRICRLYVYKINDDNQDRRAIQILAVYNPD